VDDDPINRKVLSWQLSDVNASVEYAADGNQALRLCQAREFDVVLTDLHMPVMGGLALTRAIRAGRALTRQPVIIVTSADASELAWPLCQDAGADAYLSKPFSLTQLKFSLYQEIEQTRRAV
jgi:CheY-like chemotaxis protein